MHTSCLAHPALLCSASHGHELLARSAPECTASLAPACKTSFTLLPCMPHIGVLGLPCAQPFLHTQHQCAQPPCTSNTGALGLPCVQAPCTLTTSRHNLSSTGLLHTQHQHAQPPTCTDPLHTQHQRAGPPTCTGLLAHSAPMCTNVLHTRSQRIRPPTGVNLLHTQHQRAKPPTCTSLLHTQHQHNDDGGGVTPNRDPSPTVLNEGPPPN